MLTANYLDKEKDQKLFFKIHKNLLLFTNQEAKISDEFNSLEDWGEYDNFMDDAGKLRDHLFHNKKIIDQFIKENPAKFNEQELIITKDWKKAVIGDFLLLKHLKNYSIFLDGDADKVYGVSGLMSAIEDIAPYYELPKYVGVALIPFAGKIVYDGVIIANGMIFGNNYIRSFKEDYNRIKKDFGIITKLID